jgi:hypothetical protein
VLKRLQGEGVDLSKLWGEDELAGFGLDSGERIGEGEARRTLAERFGVPPFSVLDARQGYWQARKRAWMALGIESELGRGEAIGTDDASVGWSTLAQEAAPGQPATTAIESAATGAAGRLHGRTDGRKDGLTWGNSEQMRHPTLNYYRERNGGKVSRTDRP